MALILYLIFILMKKFYVLMLCAVLFSCSKDNQLIDSKKEELFSWDVEKIDVSTWTTSTWNALEDSETTFVEPELVIEWEKKDDTSSLEVIDSLKESSTTTTTTTETSTLKEDKDTPTEVSEEKEIDENSIISATEEKEDETSKELVDSQDSEVTSTLIDCKDFDTVSNFVKNNATWAYWNTCRDVSPEVVKVNVLSFSWDKYIYERFYVNKNSWTLVKVLIEEGTWITTDKLADKNNELKSKVIDDATLDKKYFDLK